MLDVALTFKLQKAKISLKVDTMNIYPTQFLLRLLRKVIHHLKISSFGPNLSRKPTSQNFCIVASTEMFVKLLQSKCKLPKDNLYVFECLFTC